MRSLEVFEKARKLAKKDAWLTVADAIDKATWHASEHKFAVARYETYFAKSTLTLAGNWAVLMLDAAIKFERTRIEIIKTKSDEYRRVNPRQSSWDTRSIEERDADGLNVDVYADNE